MDDAEVRLRVEALDSELEHLSTEAKGVVELLLQLYDETLTRIVKAAAASPHVVAAFARDKLVSHMLALHETASVDPAIGIPRPETAIRLDGLNFNQNTWSALQIPVAVAYFVRSSRTKRVVAYYPSAAGDVELPMPVDAWNAFERANPALRKLPPDTRALLVHAEPGVTEGWIVEIDTCFRLTATMRKRWRGVAGGDAVRAELEKFFSELRARATRKIAPPLHVIKGAV